MSMELSSLASLSPLLPPDLTGDVKGTTNDMRVKQVSKAMESVFTSQLVAEMGKGIDGDDSDSKESDPYSDFIQQAMTQGVTQGGGLGLAKTIENYLNHRNEKPEGHMPLKTPNNSYHVTSAN